MAAPGRRGLGRSGKGVLGYSATGSLVDCRQGALAALGKGTLSAAGRDVNVKVYLVQILLFLPCMSKVDCLLFFNGMTAFGQS